MDVTRIHEYTDIYMEAYMRALNKTHNADLAVQVLLFLRRRNAGVLWRSRGQRYDCRTFLPVL